MQQEGEKLEKRIVLSELQKAKVLDNIHKMVRDGIYGQDYTIANRDKNRRLKRDYNIDDTKIKQILMDLQTDNFVKAEKSDNQEHPNDIVYVFKKTTLLMAKWQENADYERVRLYIKVTWPVENTIMFIISFHEDNI